MLEQFLSFAYWTVLISLIAGVLLGFLTGTFYFMRERADKRPDWFFGALLFTFALTLVHNLILHQNLIKEHPGLWFLPVYFTLSLGPLFFFFVKLRLFPNYTLRWTDLKHAILPLGQFIYFLWFFTRPIDIRIEMGRQFWSPFYGAMEMVLYIVTFSSYLLFSYRYIRYKKAVIRNQSGIQQSSLQVFWLKRLVKVLFVIFLFNAGYIITDFFTYELFNINLHLIKGFDYIGSLSFAVMMLWLAFNGWVMRHA
ncbi:MAG: hypothetical protein KDC24_11950 [Saprospiraceae bacterium]|nr:hypothetical protein [Saprospiraceae bacterium]